MVGRYGSDELNRFLVWIFIAILFVRIFIHSGFWYWLELAVIVVIYYRMFSKNTSQRFKENQRYLNLRFRVTEWAKGVRSENGKKTWKKSKSIRSSNVRTVVRRSEFQEDMERSASTAGNVDMILSEELDSLVTE